jgi:NADH:ubiquinone oxidoreductase subunit
MDTNKKDIVARDTWAGFDAELPPEWESWLRHRRANLPSEKEATQSLALAEMKKMNAAKQEEARHAELVAAGLDPSPPALQDHEKTPYPKYAEYERMPGEMQLQNK